MNMTVCMPAPHASGLNRKRWIYIHKSFIVLSERIKPEIVFFGDCLFDSRRDMLQWDKYFSNINCLNFCIRGDKIQNILWRLVNGELKNVQPRILVLCIGKNNIFNSSEEIGHGIMKCVRMLRHRLPATEIIVPSLVSRVFRNTRLRKRDQCINAFVKSKTVHLSRVHTVNILRNYIQFFNVIVTRPIHITYYGPRIVTKDFEPLLMKINQLMRSVRSVQSMQLDA